MRVLVGSGTCRWGRHSAPVGQWGWGQQFHGHPNPYQAPQLASSVRRSRHAQYGDVPHMVKAAAAGDARGRVVDGSAGSVMCRQARCAVPWQRILAPMPLNSQVPSHDWSQHVHLPSRQSAPAGHFLPHTPQLASSSSRLTHLAYGSAPHLVRGASQVSVASAWRRGDPETAGACKAGRGGRQGQSGAWVGQGAFPAASPTAVTVHACMQRRAAGKAAARAYLACCCASPVRSLLRQSGRAGRGGGGRGGLRASHGSFRARGGRGRSRARYRRRAPHHAAAGAGPLAHSATASRAAAISTGVRGMGQEGGVVWRDGWPGRPGLWRCGCSHSALLGCWRQGWMLWVACVSCESAECSRPGALPMFARSGAACSNSLRFQPLHTPAIDALWYGV